MVDTKEITWSCHSKDFCKNAFSSKKYKQLYPGVFLQILFISRLHLGWLLKENKAYAVKLSIHFSVCLSVGMSETNSAGRSQTTLAGGHMSQTMFLKLSRNERIIFFLVVHI